MHGQWDRAQVGSGQHHHGITVCGTAFVREELGLAGLLETDLREPGLGDGAGDDRCGLAGTREPGGKRQRMECEGGAARVGPAESDGCILVAQNGQRLGEEAESFFRSADPDDGKIDAAAARGSLEHFRATDREKGRKTGIMPIRPGLREKFRTDAGRIAQGNCQGRNAR